jgi:hypothetical protein
MIPALSGSFNLARLIVISAVIVPAVFFPETIDNGLNSLKVALLRNSDILVSYKR